MSVGILKYQVAESNNLILGQAGFDCYYNGAAPSNVEGTWIALMCLGTSYSSYISVHAETAIGDNLSDDGSTGEVTMMPGQIIYGPFNKLVSATLGIGENLIAFRG